MKLKIVLIVLGVIAVLFLMEYLGGDFFGSVI